MSDPEELLRGVGAEARESYYRRAGMRPVFWLSVACILLGLAIVGVYVGDSTWRIVVLGAAFGMLLATLWVCLR